MSDAGLILPMAPVLADGPRTARVYHVSVQAVITCECGSRAPIVIPASDRAGFCASCRAKWVIARVDFRNDDGQITLDVSVAKWRGTLHASTDLDVPLTPRT